MPHPMLNRDAYEAQLDRMHQFFPRIDSKVSALFAIGSGEIAVAALNLSADDLRAWWIALPLAMFLGTSVWMYLNLYRCAYPHLDGGHASLVYFNEIAKLREAEFITKMQAISDTAYSADLAGQIWRNAEIVSCKFRYLKHATIAAMLSLIPWAILLVSSSLTHWRVPAFSA